MKPPRQAVLARAACLLAALAAAPAFAQVTFYENDNYQGRTFSTQRSINSFLDAGFNDRASSIVVSSQRWEVCDDIRFGGRCVVLREGSYPSLRAMGMNDRISSVRQLRANQQVNEDRYAPLPPAPTAWQRRGNERLFEADVTSVRAVMGPTEQRCWMEKQDVVNENPRRENNIPGALGGALLGGIIGHQIGGGTGRDIATVGGAVAGGVLGSRIGSDGRSVSTRDVQRCEKMPSRAGTDHWDVSYRFRGQDHLVQLKQPPGRTITVNREGEPRE